MSKNRKHYLIVSALILLLIGMGCTAAPALGAAEKTPAGAAEECEQVDPPVDLVPGYLPEGYELTEAYLMKGEEFEEDDIWYVPGKGDATLIEFYGTGEDDFLEITTSASPYDSLEPWIEEINNLEYADEDMDSDEDVDSETEGSNDSEEEDFDFEFSFEDDTVTIKGVAILLEDWTDEYGTFSVATFVHAGQFIVVEGTISTDEMTKVVESLPVLP